MEKIVKDEFYNHISNGGFSFDVYVKDNTQYLELGMSSFGAYQAHIIPLTETIIATLEKVIAAAKEQRLHPDVNLSKYLEELVESSDPEERESRCDGHSFEEDDAKDEESEGLILKSKE